MAEHAQPVRWRYGPFRRDWGWLAIALVSLVCTGFVTYAGGRSGSLSCRRAPDGGACTLTTRYGFIPFDETRFPIEAVREVSVSPGWSDDYTEIFLDRGRLVFHGAGRSTADRIHAFIFDRTGEARLDERSLPQLAFVFVAVPLIFLGLGLVKLVTMVRRRPGIIEVCLFDREAITVTERWCGLALRKRTVSLRGAVEIRVVHTMAQGFGDEYPVGLVSVVDGAEGIRPLTTHRLPGTDVHDQLATRLAEATGCELNRIAAD